MSPQPLSPGAACSWSELVQVSRVVLPACLIGRVSSERSPYTQPCVSGDTRAKALGTWVSPCVVPVAAFQGKERQNAACLWLFRSPLLVGLLLFPYLITSAFPERMLSLHVGV